jgi:hypothetical protein
VGKVSRGMSRVVMVVPPTVTFRQTGGQVNCLVGHLFPAGQHRFQVVRPNFSDVFALIGRFGGAPFPLEYARMRYRVTQPLPVLKILNHDIVIHGEIEA